MLGDDDGEYFSRVIMASNGIRFVPDAKVYYRASGTNRLSTIGSSNEKKDAQFISMKLHVQYLRSLEDSDRVRAACVKYLQTWFIYFYPERPDIVQQARELAASLGGDLKTPQLSWKYRWIKEMFGWDNAKWVQEALRSAKAAWSASWDKVLYRWEKYIRKTSLQQTAL
jgi:hypothetical protein